MYNCNSEEEEKVHQKSRCWRFRWTNMYYTDSHQITQHIMTDNVSSNHSQKPWNAIECWRMLNQNGILWLTDGAKRIPVKWEY